MVMDQRTPASRLASWFDCQMAHFARSGGGVKKKATAKKSGKPRRVREGGGKRERSERRTSSRQVSPVGALVVRVLGVELVLEELDVAAVVRVLVRGGRRGRLLGWLRSRDEGRRRPVGLRDPAVVVRLVLDLCERVVGCRGHPGWSWDGRGAAREEERRSGWVDGERAQSRQELFGSRGPRSERQLCGIQKIKRWFERDRTFDFTDAYSATGHQHSSRAVGQLRRRQAGRRERDEVERSQRLPFL